MSVLATITKVLDTGTHNPQYDNYAYMLEVKIEHNGEMHTRKVKSNTPSKTQYKPAPGDQIEYWEINKSKYDGGPGWGNIKKVISSGGSSNGRSPAANREIQEAEKNLSITSQVAFKELSPYFLDRMKDTHYESADFKKILEFWGSSARYVAANYLTGTASGVPPKPSKPQAPPVEVAQEALSVPEETDDDLPF